MPEPQRIRGEVPEAGVSQSSSAQSSSAQASKSSQPAETAEIATQQEAAQPEWPSDAAAEQAAALAKSEKTGQDWPSEEDAARAVQAPVEHVPDVSSAHTADQASAEAPDTEPGGSESSDAARSGAEAASPGSAHAESSSAAEPTGSGEPPAGSGASESAGEVVSEETAEQQESESAGETDDSSDDGPDGSDHEGDSGADADDDSAGEGRDSAERAASDASEVADASGSTKSLDSSSSSGASSSSGVEEPVADRQADGRSEPSGEVTNVTESEAAGAEADEAADTPTKSAEAERAAGAAEPAEAAADEPEAKSGEAATTAVAGATVNRAEIPVESPAERTQQIERVQLDQPTNRLAREELNQSTVQFLVGELKDQPEDKDQPEGTGQAGGTAGREEPPTPPSGLRIAPGPQNTRMLPIQQPPEQTQQFARPDFTSPPTAQRPPAAQQPRVAQPHDFQLASAPPPAIDDTQQLSPVPPAPSAPSPSQAFPAERITGYQPPAQPDTQRPAPEKIAAQRPRRGRTPFVVVAVVVIAGIAAAVGFAGLPRLTGPVIAEPPPPVRLQPAIKPVTGGQPPSASGLEAKLASAASNPALGTFGGAVLDPATGRTLWQRNPGQALIPASTGKLLMTSAAMLTLNHEQRFSTKVVRGSQPGSVVLVAGGDPTLTALPRGHDSVYPGAARIDDLVGQVKAATGGSVTSVSLDTSRYTGPASGPGWLPQDVQDGFVAPIEPIMLEGGRADPTKDVSPRSHTPALDAAHQLASRLGTSTVSSGTAPPGAQVLGEVRSPTVREMVEIVLQHSDNVLAEALAREVAISTGNEPSFAGAVKAVREVLGRNGFDLAGTSMVDGSGLSLENRVTPQLLGSLMAAAAAPELPDGGLDVKAAKLRAMLTGLPVAGGSGSLADRYQNAGVAGRGWVRAKTGTLSNANSLSGLVVTQDGHLLVFAFMSNGSGSDVARPALDEVAASLRKCGCH